MLEELCGKIDKIEFFTKGKRGFLYKGIYKGKSVVIKTKNPHSKAVGRIVNEAKYLEILNKHNIGPKLLFYAEEYLVYEFIEGIFFEDYLVQEKSSQKVRKVLRDLFEQLYTLDKLGINKEEMHHPVKHILIDKINKPWLVDFERCYKTEKPKNVTQFAQYLTSKRMVGILKGKGISVEKEKSINLTKEYKKEINKRNLEKIVKMFC